MMYCLSIVLIFNPLPESRRNNIGPVLRSLTIQLAIEGLLGIKPSKPEYLRNG